MPFSTVEAWKRINATLQGEGFVSVPSPVDQAVTHERFDLAQRDAWYFGQVQTKRGPVGIYLSVPDLEFTRPPSIWLNQRPSWLTGWRPHLIFIPVLAREYLCYSDHESFQLLSHDPARALLRVLEDTKITLDRIADPTSVIEDSRREISLLWRERSDLLFCDVEPTTGVEVCAMGKTTRNSRNVYLVSHNPHVLAKKLCISESVKVIGSAAIFPMPKTPLYITQAGPPKTLAEVRAWLHESSPETLAHWAALLKSKKQYENGIHCHFFRTNADLIGFSFLPSYRLKSIQGARKISQFISRHVHQKPAPIERLSAIRVDSDYLVRRNLPPNVPDLRGKKLLLIGCGTIGGYLAPALVKLGAGQAIKKIVGLLRLCDNQVLTAQNIGRHYLGMNRLGENKAVALRDELHLHHPGTCVEVTEEDVFRDCDALLNFDIVINATGYEPCGRRLSKYLRQNNWLERKKALLHVWVEGRGGVVRTLLEDGKNAACFDCMWHYSPNQEPRVRHEPYSDSKWYARTNDGYATMTPFAVSASHAATALAIESALSWLGGTPKPRFRSRSTEGNGVRPSTSCDLSRNPNCPLCST